MIQTGYSLGSVQHYIETIFLIQIVQFVNIELLVIVFLIKASVWVTCLNLSTTYPGEFSLWIFS